MNEQDIDRRLGALLRQAEPEPDPIFVERALLSARIDREFRIARRRAWTRATIDCGAAVVVAVSFLLLSGMPGAGSGGFILPGGPAMAGLVMLLLWGLVALPISSGRRRLAG